MQSPEAGVNSMFKKLETTSVAGAESEGEGHYTCIGGGGVQITEGFVGFLYSGFFSE